MDRTDEQKLVKLYMDLTGTNESCARNVWMYVCEECEETRDAPKDPTKPEPEEETKGKVPRANGLSDAGVLLAVCSLFLGPKLAQAETQTGDDSKPRQGQLLPLQPLSLADTINIALKQNPTILKAQRDLEAAQGVAVQTRAIAIPKVTATGEFSAVQNIDIDLFRVPGGLTFGNNQSWGSQIKLVQSLYEGGRMLSSLRAARLTTEQSVLNYQTTVADTVLAVELGYFDVLLADQQITVQEASVELLTNELTDTTKRFDAGTVPRFNVLRAEVELANARPKLIRARNELRISKNNLANLMGVNLPKAALEDIPLTLSGKLEAEPFDMDLSRAIALALERRSELGALRKAEALRKEDIVTAKAGYRPSVQAYAGYDIHNSMLSQDLSFELHGWIAGAQLTWNLFDGLSTQGRIKQAKANYDRAGVELDDVARRIELEVRTARSNFIEAREVLESQKKVVEEAEEALRLARARNEAGTGTQLDVLSAQTALTDARNTQIQALHDYEAARARMERAVGVSVPEPEVQR
jgi:outer membrane protein